MQSKSLVDPSEPLFTDEKSTLEKIAEHGAKVFFEGEMGILLSFVLRSQS